MYNAARQNNTFVFEGSGIGHILASKLLEFLGGEISQVLVAPDMPAFLEVGLHQPLLRLELPAVGLGEMQ